MIRSVLLSVALLGILLYAILRLQSTYEEGLPERTINVDIFADRIVYRTRNYATPSGLSIGLRAANIKPEKVVLHVCERMDDLEAIVAMLRERGQTQFDVELPEDC